MFNIGDNEVYEETNNHLAIIPRSARVRKVHLKSVVHNDETETVLCCDCKEVSNKIFHASAF